MKKRRPQLLIQIAFPFVSRGAETQSSIRGGTSDYRRRTWLESHVRVSHSRVFVIGQAWKGPPGIAVSRSRTSWVRRSIPPAFRSAVRRASG